MITVELKESPEEIFTVSKALLFQTSPYFAGALRDGFMESSTRRLEIPGCDAETFKAFMHYAASGILPDMKIEPTANCVTTLITNRRILLIKIWVLGDYLGRIVQLQNHAMVRLMDCFKSHLLASKEVSVAFSLTLRGSPLRKVFVDEWLFRTIYDRYRDQERLDYIDKVNHELTAIEDFYPDLSRKISKCHTRHGDVHVKDCFPGTADDIGEYLVFDGDYTGLVA